jgi:hypothetical protein
MEVILTLCFSSISCLAISRCAVCICLVVVIVCLFFILRLRFQVLASTQYPL